MDPYFKKPSAGVDGPLGTYDINPGSVAVWRMQLNEGQFGRIALVAGKDLVVKSNNSMCVPNDEAVFKQKNLPGDVRIIEFYALSTGGRYDIGGAMIEARRGDSVVAYFQVQVHSIGGKRAFFELGGLHMALNAPDTPVPYNMKYTETIRGGVAAEDIIQKVVDKSSLAHVVFSCHGQPVKANGPYLQIGSGFTDDNVELFAKLYPIVTQVIWIGSCSICGSDEGKKFCAAMAKKSGCYVVAPAIVLPPMKAGLNQIEVFTRSLPHYFNREGDLMAQKDFLQLAPQLGFSIVRVQ